MKTYLLIGGIVLLILLSLFLIQKNGSNELTEEAGLPEGAVEESEPSQENMAQESDDAEGEIEGSPYNNVAEQATLESVGSYTGSGMATRAFNGERFFHTVKADIPDPAEGKFYEGWLVDGAEFFSTGKMIKKDQQYYLEYFDEIDQSSYDFVVITEETLADGLDNKPETHVLEGTF